jgi:hypothetical protein
MILRLLILCIVIELFIYKTSIYATNIHNNTGLCLLLMLWLNSAIFRESIHQYLKLAEIYDISNAYSIVVICAAKFGSIKYCKIG